MKIKALRPEGDIFVTPRKGPPLHTHKSDFSVITLGTGCPVPVMGRSHPSTLIQYKGTYFLIDVGEGALLRIAEAGIPCGKIKNVLLTHHHADHLGGYAYFIISSWMNGRDNLDLIGPPGTGAIQKGFVGYYKEDLTYRSTLMGRALETTYQANIREIEDKDQFTLDGLTITTAKLVHTAHNIAYRFEADGKSIVVTGDTSYTPALAELAKDADLLVMDCAGLVDRGHIGAARIPKNIKANEDASRCTVPPHPGKGEMARMAKDANAKAILTTHYGAVEIDEPASIASLREDGYQGEIIFGRDLMEVSL